MGASLPYPIALGLRGLRRHPRTMLLAIATLALGLAAVMTMLTLLSMLSADPLPGRSDQLYLGWVDSRQASKTTADSPDRKIPMKMWKLGDVQAMQRLYPDVPQVGVVNTLAGLSNPTTSATESGLLVMATGPFASMFGVPLSSGRFWTSQEELDRANVIILGSAFAAKLFPKGNAIGQMVSLKKHSFRVIGIAGGWNPQPSVYSLQDAKKAWENVPPDAYVPAVAATDAGVVPIVDLDCDDDGLGGVRFNSLDQQRCRWLSLWAQLPDSSTARAYRDHLQAYAQSRHDAGVFQRPPHVDLYSMRQWLNLLNVIPDDVTLNLWLAFALLALCMVNVAGLLAARFLRRSGELGVRRVLGASRRDIVLQCLAEAGTAGLVGGLLAWPLTLFGLWLIRIQDRSYSDMAHFQPGVFAVLFCGAVAIGVLVGLLPSWRASRLEPVLQVRSL